MPSDVHKKTASEIFDVPEDQVTPEQRRAARAINFSAVYGGIHDSVEVAVGDGMPEEPFAFLRALKDTPLPALKEMFTAEPGPLKMDWDERVHLGIPKRGPRMWNFPIHAVESDKLRQLIGKSLAISAFKDFDYAAIERRLVWLTARANWTLQDCHWRDGEE